MSKSNREDVKLQRKKYRHWVISVFLITVLVSGVISYVSDEIMENSSVAVAFIILLIIVLVGIAFDIVGVAVATADEKPFHSMASRKVAGAQEAITLLRSAERVSSICNDVVGDICGVISGAASATIAGQVIRAASFTWPQVIILLMSALVAGLTVGGKALGKAFAMNSCTQIVHFVGKLIHAFRRRPRSARKK